MSNPALPLPVLRSSSSVLPHDVEFVQGEVRRLSPGSMVLIKPPFFTPFTPPLGIAILKSYLRNFGVDVRCHDFNAEMQLWDTHHEYFRIVQTLEQVSINDGYSKLWWIMNAHMLAFVNGGTAQECRSVLRAVCPLYGIHCDEEILTKLHRCVERFFARLEQAMNRINLENVTTVGVSVYTTSLASSLFLLRKLKERKPSLTTIMGGGVFADDLALGSENLEILIREYPFVDHVILGEGEQLLHGLLSGQLAHKRVISIQDLAGVTLPVGDVPPPDFSDFNLDDYYHLTIEGARSCPFECSFCSETIQWGKYRKKGSDSFAGQVLDLADRYGNSSFFLADSLMNPYIMAFSGELLKRKANILYDGYLRADNVAASRERVNGWAKSGLYRVRLGVESASARVLEAMDKRTTPQIISEALKNLANAGVRTTTYWITGFPGETETSFTETLDFVRAHHRYIYELEAHPFYYYPYGQVGSRLYQSRSLYPDDVTRLIRFKVWDVIDQQPTRSERYHRLSRISRLAADFGLVNIYTMEARYEAEARWLALHPLAREVYSGTYHARALENSEGDSAEAPVETPLTGEILGYTVRTPQEIDHELLERAVAELVKTTETSCRVSATVASDWQAVAGPADSDPSVSDRMRFLESLKSESEGFRAMLVRAGDAVELCTLADRAVLDHRGLILLTQDILHLLIQLKEGADPHLQPITTPISHVRRDPERLALLERTTAFVNELAGQRASESLFGIAFETEAVESVNGMTWSFIDQLQLAREWFLLSSIASVIFGFPDLEEKRIAVTIDERLVDARLRNTPGALTSFRLLTKETFPAERPNRTPKRLAEEISKAIAAAPPVLATLAAGEYDILIDLGAACEGVWVGDDRWRPQGFLSSPAIGRSDCFAVAPVIAGDGTLRFLIRRRAGAFDDAFIEDFARRLEQSTARLLTNVSAMAAAEPFWIAEFRSPFQSPYKAPYKGFDRDDAGGGFASVPLPEPSDECLKTLGIESWSFCFAVYCLALSRICGQEDLVVVVSDEFEGERQLIPFCARGDWATTLKEYCRTMDQRLAMVRRNSTGSFSLAEEILETFAFDPIAEMNAGGVGFLNPAAADDSPDRFFSELSPAPRFIMTISLNGTKSECVLWRRADALDAHAQHLVRLYSRILAEAESDPLIPIGRIGSEHHQNTAKAALKAQVFEF